VWIKELTRTECLAVLASTQLARLACVREMQPYVVPIYHAYHDQSIYSFSEPGQKIEWMRANPLVCVEADHMRREQWATVVAFGRYEELSDTPEFRNERALAFSLLQRRATWWEPGSSKPIPRDTPAVPVFYRIRLDQITGRCGAFDEAVADTTPGGSALDEQGWLRKMIRHTR
jgi:nitroimidazol reductase NimA-like FMN-containing flavoprotein (pyridoxamine 5'-phosphate oxidase superfamily)